MRQLGRLVAVGIVLAGAASLADPNDFVLNQLGNPVPGGMNFSAAADGNFQAFAREFAAGLSGSTLTATHTLGYNGFAVAAELGVVNFSSGDPTALKAGEFVLPTEKKFSGPLLLPAVHFRKGLPWSLELGGKVTWIDKSQMTAGTLEGRWAITEGYKMLPEVTLRAYGTKLFNTKDFDLYTAGTDLTVGKRFALGGMVTLSPYIGWNLGFDHAASSRVDFNTARTQADSESSIDAALADTARYSGVAASDNHHNRWYLGARFVGGAVSLAAELSIASMGSLDSPDPATPGSASRDLPSVVTFSTALGLEY
jgi:hypothetical protein